MNQQEVPKVVGVALLIAITGILGTACGSDEPTTTATPRPAQADAAATAQADIEDFTHSDLTVNVGTTVTWTNQDNVSHTSTSDDPMWNSGRLASGESFSFTFTEPGTHAYHCDIHPSMMATITVNP